MFNYKTAVGPVVAAGVLLYETVTGHQVKQSVQTIITTDTIGVIGFVYVVWGVWKSHIKKEGNK